MSTPDISAKASPMIKAGHDLWLEAVLEALFVLAPIVIVIVRRLVDGHGSVWVSVVAAPEVAFAAMILFGLGLVRFVNGALTAPMVSTIRIALLVAVIVLLGVAPAAVVAFVTLDHSSPVNASIRVLQGVQLAAGIVCFVVLARLGSELRMEHERARAKGRQ